MGKKNNGSQSDITKGILFFYDWLDAMSILNPKEFKEMIMAMTEFQRNGVELPKLEGTSKYIAPLIFNQLRTRMDKVSAGRAGALSKWGTGDDADGQDSYADTDGITDSITDSSVDGTAVSSAIDPRASIRASTSNEASTSFRERADVHAPAREEKNGKNCFGEFENVLMTDSEYEAICTRFGKNAQGLINNLSRKMKSKGYKFEDHYATLILWAESDGISGDGENGGSGESIEKSYDTDEFFEASLKRSYEEFEKHYGMEGRVAEEAECERSGG